MFIRTKKHKEIIARYEATIKDLQERCYVKSILEKLIDKETKFGSSMIIGSNGNWDVNLPDTVPQYVPDFFGGKVIKQEARKVIQVDKEGNVTTGLTAKQADDGFAYVLVRL
jgi:hypothetical protein